MQCASCGSDNPDGFRYCGSCGTELSARPCSSCGFAAPAGTRFCGRCGTALTIDVGTATAPDVPSLVRGASPEERKLATVLFADVVGFTSLAEGTDPETVARTVDAAFRRMAQVVDEHGGTVDKYLGDCLMAVFGVPQAHADDAERAVAAGLAMRALGGDLAFSIGVNTGEVMVTSVGRDGEVTVIGDTVNVAARLEKAAGPGQVLVGRLTAELANERVVFTERQPVLLKGKADPVDVWEAVALRPESDDIDGGGATRPPFTGRHDELAFLRAQWRRAVRDRRSTVVLLAGEAGLGTTRLIEELASDPWGPEGAVPGTGDPLIVRATYPAYGGLGGPRVAADIIRQLGPTDDPHVDARVRSLAGELHPSLKSIDPTALASEQLWAFRRLLEIKGEDGPILLAVDDIHRATDRTIDLLRELTARVTDVPMLFILAGRPDPPAWLASFPSATVMRLNPLGSADAVTLANSLVSEGRLSADAAAALAGRAGGNPLHVRELVARLLARRELVETPDGLQLAGNVSLPPSLHAILAARLDALNADEKLCVQHVAVLGDAATIDQVESLGLADAGRVLQALVVSGLIHQGGDGCYDVADPLMREVAYETLPRNVRADRHRLAAHVSSSSVDRARHLDRAVGYAPDDVALVDEARVALADAGRELMETSRVVDGLLLLQRAIELGLDDRALLLRAAQAFAELGRTADAEAVLERLLGASDREHDPELDAHARHIRGLSLLFAAPADAREPLTEAARAWAALGNTNKEGWARANLGVAEFMSGNGPAAAATLEAALACFGRIGDRSGELACYRFLSLVRPEDPRVPEWLAESLRVAEETGDRTAQVTTLNTLAWNEFLRVRLGGPEDIADAFGYCRRLAHLSREIGAHDLQSYGDLLLADMARLQGDFDTARAALAAAQESEDESDRGRALFAAVEWAVARATGSSAPPPELPVDVHDPVVLTAVFIVAEERGMSGDVEGAVALMDAIGGRRGLELLEHLVGGMLKALTDLVVGDFESARIGAEQALASARLLRARPAIAAAQGALAEIAIRADPVDGAEHARARLDQLDVPTAGMARALALRPRALLGDATARAELAELTERLAAPALGWALLETN